ncbi:MAG: hypothetical protein GMKNLPBB_00978 [Myxococcota bacterium]|nr:hypothetical protein [Myxococcota bacterium]
MPFTAPDDSLCAPWDESPEVLENGDGLPGKHIYAIFVAGFCNLNCHYCYLPDRKGPGMSRDMAEATLQFIASRPARRRDVGFFGVEPMTEWELIQWMIARALEVVPGVEFSLNTNGTLFTPDRLDFLASHGCKIAISIDGAPETHDRNRPTLGGKGSWKLLARHIPDLVKYPHKVYTRITVAPDRAHCFDADVAAIFGLGLPRVSFSMDLTADWSDAQLDSLEASCERLADWYIRQLESGAIPEIASWDSIGKGRSVPKAGLFCGAGDILLSIALDGTIYPCWRYAGDKLHPIGHVKTGMDREKQAPFAGFDTLGQMKGCSTCANNRTCGRCAWVSEKYAGAMDRVTHAQCRGSAIFIAAGQRVSRELLARQNPIYLSRLLGRALRTVGEPGAPAPEAMGESTGDVVLLRGAGGRFYAVPRSELAALQALAPDRAGAGAAT